MRPAISFALVGPCSGALVLAVEHRLLPAAVSPVVPSLGSNDVRYVAVDEDDSGVGTPRASQVDGSTACDCAAHEREACTGVACSLLRCYRSASRVGYGVQLTILVKRLPVSTDEVDAAFYVTILEVVTALLIVERVLSAYKGTVVERSFVA